MVTIDYCPITATKSKILKGWDDKTSTNYHTGVDIEASTVCSISDGTVIQVGQSDEGLCVTIQHNSSTMFRYKHMKSVNVKAGAHVDCTAIIGKADKFVHFEYAKKHDLTRSWPVRICDQEYYKVDPTDYVTNKIAFFDPELADPGVM